MRNMIFYKIAEKNRSLEEKGKTSLETLLKML